jgi:hypothetical protein
MNSESRQILNDIYPNDFKSDGSMNANGNDDKNDKLKGIYVEEHRRKEGRR